GLAPLASPPPFGKSWTETLNHAIYNKQLLIALALNKNPTPTSPSASILQERTPFISNNEPTRIYDGGILLN
ncbi:MAG: hypothetical protein K2J79_02920, partial [Ruminiclostridium sp.]|nr:hypothetical protein [Ruminiclostridium sp.]